MAACCTPRTSTWKKSSWARCAAGPWTSTRLPKKICKAIAKRLDRKVKDLVVTVLDRPRHEKLIADIRKTGARIRLISDGDLSAGISAAVSDMGVHAVMGTGGAPEGVLTAAALRCLNGQILGTACREKAPSIGSGWRKWESRIPREFTTPLIWRLGKKIIFACTGVTARRLAARRAILRRRNAHAIADYDLRGSADSLHRFRPPGKGIATRECASIDSNRLSRGRYSRPRPSNDIIEVEFLSSATAASGALRHYGRRDPGRGPGSACEASEALVLAACGGSGRAI